MRSDHAGKFTSSKTARPLPSPRTSDKNSENFDAAFGSKYTSDGRSIKTTKTGVLKEMSQNEPRLTQFMSKKGIMTTADSRFNGMIVLDLESMSNEEIYRKPQFRHDAVDNSRPRVRQQKSFAEIEMLEGMVRTKDDLVSMIDDSEENIETLLDSLTSKKKEIRDEQNKLLKELEDLGLKLKDFDKPVGINLRHCTVVSPYLTRCSQQVVNKLAGVSENLSNKETKNEIQRAVESISKEREERETLIISLLSLDTTTLRERLNMLSEDLKSKNTEKVAAVERIELLASEIIELEEAIKEELQYQEKLHHLKSLKETAVNRASRAANVLNEIAKRKVELENEIRDIHSNIRDAVKDKNELSGELNNIIDTQSYQPMVNLCQKIDESDLEENTATRFMSEFVTKLKQIEISRQMDCDLNTQESISSTRKLYLGAINLAGRVLSMLGKNNAESAITSFEADYSTLEESSRIAAALATKTREILRDLFEIVKIKFDEEQKPKSLDLWIENIKIYLIETCKISENLYSVLTKRSELSKSIKIMIDDVQAKEQQCSDLNRQRSDIINTIPELKQDARSCNHQLAMLRSQSTATATDGDETPRETIDEMDEEILGQWTQRNACPERFCTKEQIKASRASESERLQGRVQVLSEDILEVEESVQQVQHEQHYIQDKIRAYRKGLIEGFQNELREFHCIASLFDYMSKPILSREIGVSVVDNLLHDLASVVQQINSEINRQKRIMKHLSKGEDYSHEEKVFDEMLTANIFKIKTQLGELNEQQIPELKEIENMVNEAEAVNMKLKEELNKVLDSIEGTEQAFLQKLALAVQNGAVHREEIPQLFKNYKKLGESNYEEYIDAKLFDEESVDQNQSEIVSQIESSCMNYRHTANPRLGCSKEGVNGRQVKSNINLRGGRETYEERNSGPRISQNHYMVEDEEAEHTNAHMTEEYSERSVAIEEFPEDNEVNEDIINSFPNKIFSKVLAVYAQSYCLFRTSVLEKLSNGIIVFGNKGINAAANKFCPITFYEEQTTKKRRSTIEAHGFVKRLMRFDFDAAKLQFFSNKAKSRNMTPSKRGHSDEVIAVNNRWMLEEEFDLDEVAGLVLPEISTKMLKARLKDFYQPSQFGVYNQAELCYMEECEYFLFNLDLMERGRLECLVDNFASFLDIYTGISFLQH